MDCNFQESKSRNIRDKLLIGIRNHALLERLLRQNVLDVKFVVEQCRVSEQPRIHSEMMSGDKSVSREKQDAASLKVLDSKENQQNSNKKCRNYGITLLRLDKSARYAEN